MSERDRSPGSSEELRHDNEAAPTTREWVAALLVVVIVAVIIVAGGIWFVGSFILQTCGTRPACG